MREKHALDDRFTDFADTISEGMGRWQVSLVAIVLIAAWTLFCALTQGAGWWYGIFYNLPLNLVTTVAELFIGFLIAAAANRVERRHESLLEKIERQEERILAILAYLETRPRAMRVAREGQPP